jgi:hypothetical protein
MADPTPPPPKQGKSPAADPALAALTVRFEEAGVVKVEELGRVVLAASPLWATVAFLAREADPAGTLQAPRVVLRRYKKRGGRYVVDKHFNLTTARQARALASTLLSWFPNDDDATEPDDSSADEPG